MFMPSLLVLCLGTKILMQYAFTVVDATQTKSKSSKLWPRTINLWHFFLLLYLWYHQWTHSSEWLMHLFCVFPHSSISHMYIWFNTILSVQCLSYPSSGADWRVQGGAWEGKAIDLLRYIFCFSSAKQSTDSAQTCEAVGGGVGLKSRSFEYSEIRWNM